MQDGRLLDERRCYSAQDIDRQGRNDPPKYQYYGRKVPHDDQYIPSTSLTAARKFAWATKFFAIAYSS